MSRPNLLFTASKSDLKHLRWKFWVWHCSVKLKNLRVALFMRAKNSECGMAQLHHTALCVVPRCHRYHVWFFFKTDHPTFPVLYFIATPKHKNPFCSFDRSRDKKKTNLLIFYTPCTLSPLFGLPPQFHDIWVWEASFLYSLLNFVN